MKHSIYTINESTWMIAEYNDTTSVYMYLLEGEEKAMLIDTGYGCIPLDEIVKGLTDKPVEVYLTHGHVDHIGGTVFFVPAYMREEDRDVYKMHSGRGLRNFFIPDEMKESKDPREETIALTKESIELGNREITVLFTPGHSAGSVCFYDKKNRWLFTGDTCCKADVLLNIPFAVPLDVYRDSIDRLLTIDFEKTWPGHHSFPVEKEIVCQFKEAADNILAGNMTGVSELQGDQKTIRYAYKDIAILCKDEGEKK